MKEKIIIVAKCPYCQTEKPLVKGSDYVGLFNIMTERIVSICHNCKKHFFVYGEESIVFTGKPMTNDDIRFYKQEIKKEKQCREEEIGELQKRPYE